MKNLSTRLLLTCASIGAVFGVVAIGTTYAMAAVAAIAPAYSVVFSGYFLMPGVVAMTLLRRPAVGLLTQLFAALIALPFSPPGYAAGPVLLIVGVLLEIIFALGRYRVWKAWMFYAGALVFAALSSVGMIVTLAAQTSSMWMLISVPIILVIGNIVYVWIARFIAKRIEQSGAVATLVRHTPPS